MHFNRLRVYYGPEEDIQPTTLTEPREEEKTVTVPLGEVFPLLADGVDREQLWTHDFVDDEITISADLYDVLMAYQHFNRPAQ